MAVTTMRNFSRLNADRKLGYVHLSSSYGHLGTVTLNKRTLQELRLKEDHLTMEVRQFTARTVAARAFDELRIPTSGIRGKRMSQAFSYQRIIAVSYKIGRLFPGLTQERLMHELQNEDKGSYAYFGKAMDLIENKVANIKGEPWIKINPSTMPMEIVPEEKVIEDLQQRCSLFPVLSFGTASIGFGTAATIMLMHSSHDIALMGGSLGVISLAFVIGTCRKIFQYAKYTDHLKLLEALRAQESADTI